MFIQIKEVVKKGMTIKVSVLLMVITLLLTLITGMYTLYAQSVNPETSIYTVFGIIHRLSAFASLCLVGYNIQLIVPWFFSKAKEKLDSKGILTLIICGLFLLLLITIIAFEPEGNISHWIYLHGNAGMGFFISLIFYILLYNNK